MLNTYKAILRGNKLEWNEDVPNHLASEKAVMVYVTILDEPVVPSEVSQQGQLMAAALEQLAATHAYADISDPAAWEREIRQDHLIPDREM
jgi:hypothetical protein